MRGNRDLSLLAAGAGVSQFGNSLSLLVLVFWATPISPLLVAAILVAELLPIVLGAPLAGALVDRLPNRKLLITALLGQGVAIAAIAPLMGTPALVVALVFVSGCGLAVAVPATSALVPHIAGEEESTRGYAMVGTARSVGNIAGVTGGALLAGFFGHPAALLIDGMTFLVYAALLVFVRAERRPSGEHAARPSALAGIRHVRQDPAAARGDHRAGVLRRRGRGDQRRGPGVRAVRAARRRVPAGRDTGLLDGRHPARQPGGGTAEDRLAGRHGAGDHRDHHGHRRADPGRVSRTSWPPGSAGSSAASPTASTT